MKLSEKAIEPLRRQFAENFAQRRAGLGMTQEQLADNWGVSRVTVTRYETGERVNPLAWAAFNWLELRKDQENDT